MQASLIAIFFAGLSSVLIGFVWYSPMLFGNVFLRLSGVTPEMAQAGRKKMPLMAFFALLAAIVVAYVMSFMWPVLVYPDWIGAIEFGVWCWIGFIAPVMLGMVLWEGKPFRLYLIHSIHWLVSLIVMALILVYGTMYLGGGATYGAGTNVDSTINVE